MFRLPVRKLDFGISFDIVRLHINVGMCPEYNTNLDMLDVDECQGTSNECPDVTYWSNDVYQCKFKYCFFFLYFTIQLKFI